MGLIHENAVCDLRLPPLGRTGRRLEPSRRVWLSGWGGLSGRAVWASCWGGAPGRAGSVGARQAGRSPSTPHRPPPSSLRPPPSAARSNDTESFHRAATWQIDAVIPRTGSQSSVEPRTPVCRPRWSSAGRRWFVARSSQVCCLSAASRPLVCCSVLVCRWSVAGLSLDCCS